MTGCEDACDGVADCRAGLARQQGHCGLHAVNVPKTLHALCAELIAVLNNSTKDHLRST